MVDLSDDLNGWTKSVYKFGCAFIHLSVSHNYLVADPFANLESTEIDSIKNHLNSYHGFSLENNLTIGSISHYLPMVFGKIAENLECYLKELENQNNL